MPQPGLIASPTTAWCRNCRRHRLVWLALPSLAPLWHMPCPLFVRCRVFAGAAASGGIVKGMRIPDGKAISNARVKPKGDISSE